MTKTCAQCKETKPHEDFCKNKRMRDGRSSYCRKCSHERERAWRLANPETVKRMFARWYHSESFQKRKGTYQRQSNLKRHYGLTPEQYDVMLAAQDGRCAICRRVERAKRNGRVVRLAVDHDHVTGQPRSLLCQSCNAGIGHFEESEPIMLAAIAYLKQHRGLALVVDHKGG